MQACWKEGIPVFNKKYNAGHWNDLGAYYGMNAALEYLNCMNNSVHINSMDEFYVNQEVRTSLLVSEFPINEYEPVFALKDADFISNNTDLYVDDLQINEQFPVFFDLINSKRTEEGCPSALVFQGSYINGMGFKFLENSFSEYVAVHDYQNVLNFDYYVNIFQPDCIIFDAAEYTFLDYYYSIDGINKFSLNPLLSTYDNYIAVDIVCDKTIESRGLLVDIYADSDLQDINYAYLVSRGEVYDMDKVLDDGDNCKFKVTIKEENYDESDVRIFFVNCEGGLKYICR